ncbi:protein PELPK1-like [Vigna unguiculata]|uniref:protein PELPK1-like n=1 Tax=Vigna unguiculata TaxID=3917 RepID=UPI001016115E|nr:protein PELPK1-like [Vigna unguiculata]
MASHSFFIFAFLVAISFSNMDIGLAGRHLMQTTPAIPSLTNPTLPPFPTLPTIPTLPQPSLPGTPTIPQVTLPPLPNLPSSFPSLSPPPSPSTP